MVLGKVSCRVPNGPSSLQHTGLQGTRRLLRAAQEQGKLTGGMEATRHMHTLRAALLAPAKACPAQTSAAALDLGTVKQHPRNFRLPNL